MTHTVKSRMDVETSQTFIQAGNATFTVVSKKTRARYTYKVTLSGDRRVYFVKVLTGSDNNSDYTYAGVLDPTTMAFRSTRASKISKDAPSVKALRWTLAKLYGPSPFPSDQCEIWHEGRCGRCGRLLTVPESINRGIGPECAKKVGL